ncbi:hypothetical protein ICN11_01265 [Polynucleobacter sp. 78F-HAINBA]|uniref:hypothetical protein n=1 Tax=unclassified Polynucleobacter TaxID=2640945 RepID=UPI001C0AB142|nr:MULTISPECIES: hypothetical protein [unclassified Polynucleobacter]MBU3588420.1 hypothetical protein [Polynucleobacter sp. 31A-FELB]MBU3590649.1 hypothetical protein [Polynucleobacter sp. 78F-HAINBA]
MKSNIVHQLQDYFLSHFFICQYLSFDWGGVRYYAPPATAFGQYSPKPLTGFHNYIGLNTCPIGEFV